VEVLEKFLWRSKNKSIWRSSKWVCKWKDVIAPTHPTQPTPPEHEAIWKNIDGSKQKQGSGAKKYTNARPLTGAATQNMAFNFLFYGHPSHNGSPYNVYLYNMVPQKLDGLFHGKSDNKMHDGWGYPYFRKPPYKSYQWIDVQPPICLYNASFAHHCDMSKSVLSVPTSEI